MTSKRDLTELNPKLRSIYGYSNTVNANVHFLDETTVIYSSGHGVTLLNLESKAQEFIPSAASTQKITALALSLKPKHVLAVAETSEHAFVCLHSLWDKQRNCKILKMPDCENIVSLAFSPDGKWLLVQGGSPTWMIVLWSVEKGKPIASAKTNAEAYKQIMNVSFHPSDSSIFCVSGNGIIKFYHISDNAIKLAANSMQKHNSKNFRSHAFISDSELIASTDRGDLILFRDFEWQGKISSSPSDGTPIDVVRRFSKGFVAGCTEGMLRVYFSKEENQIVKYECGSKFQITPSAHASRVVSLALSASEDNLICGTEASQLVVLSMSNSELLKVEDAEFVPALTPFHGPDSEGSMCINAVDSCVRKPLVVTCGKDCYIRVWNFDDGVVEVERRLDEEPVSVSLHPSGLHIVVGFSDRLRLMNMNVDSIEPVQNRDIHFSGCTICTFSNGGSLFAAASDTSVKIFGIYFEGALRNLKGHEDRVQVVKWSEDDTTLYTACSGGTIVEWNVKTGTKVAQFTDDRYRWFDLYVHNKDGQTYVCCLGSLVSSDDPRSSLVDIAWSGEDSDHEPSVSQTLPLWKGPRDSRDVDHTSFRSFAVSTRSRSVYVGSSDRQRCGIVNTYRWPLDDNMGETSDNKVATICAAPLTSSVIHGLAITQMCLAKSSEEELLFTVSEDGSLAMISANAGQGLSKRDKDSILPSLREMLVSRHSLLEINRDIDRCRKRLTKDRNQNERILRSQNSRYAASVDKMRARYDKERGTRSRKYATLMDADRKSRADHSSRLDQLQESHQLEMGSIDSSYKRKIGLEKDRLDALVRKMDKMASEGKTQNDCLRVEHEKYHETVRTEYDTKIAQEQRERAQLKIKREQVHEMLKDSSEKIEDDAKIEIREIKTTHTSRLKQEQKKTRELKKANDAMKVRHDSLRKEIRSQKEELKSLHQRERDRQDQIKSLQKDTTGYKKEIREREETIRAKDARIYDLKMKSQELEKFKFVLDYKIKELRRQIEPRMHEIVDMRTQIKEMDEELAQYVKSNAALELMISELRLKINGVDKETKLQTMKRASILAMRRDIQRDLCDIHNNFEDPDGGKMLKSSIRALAEKYMNANGSKRRDKHINSSSDLGDDGGREREHLEKAVRSLKSKLAKDAAKHQRNTRRLARENVLLTTEVNKLRRDLKISKQMKGSVRKSRVDSKYESGTPSDGSTTFLTATISAGEGAREAELQRLKISELESYLSELQSFISD
eukprot:g2604.t1